MKYVFIVICLLLLTGLIVWNVIDIVRVARTRKKQKELLKDKDNESERKE